MVFCSQIFIFLFLPLCLIFYYLLPKFFRNSVLLLFSVFFYAWGEIQYLSLIFFSILFNYIIGLLIAKWNRKQLILAVGIIVNLSSLLYYKYLGFFASIFHIDLEANLKNMVLPLGISFYTFHSISYLIDIYRKKAIAQKNLIKMGLYIVNFPQLVAGPIVRYHDVENQLSFRNHTINRFINGASLFIVGLSKKVIIANTLGEMADAMFRANIDYINSFQVWIGVLAYTLQIYFDFSGYSDMAIGLGRMFGFEFKKNFNFPYISKSIKEFWRRWHISLSNWFRDYVYIPLGGNKGSNGRTAMNLFAIFILCGLWHGASVNFLIWGLYHGAFLALERGAFGRAISRLNPVFQNTYMWLVVMVGWVFFRSDDFKMAINIIKKMFSFQSSNMVSVDVNSFINSFFVFILIIAILFALKIPYKIYFYLIKRNAFSFQIIKTTGYVTLILLFLICIADIVSNNYNPFIYYRF